MHPELSVIIPTLDEGHGIAATIDAVRRLPGSMEVIVVDGGSKDQTLSIARQHCAQTLSAPRGRGIQMSLGTQMARGEVLWFLHADTHPPSDAVEQIRRALAGKQIVGGHFGIQFRGPGYASRLLSWLYPHLQIFGLCYGDSAIFVRRSVYEQVGGFRDFPIFEDLELIQRLKRRGRFVRVPSKVTASSRRFENRSFALTFAHWTALQVLYWLGIHPKVLGRFYAPIRERTRI